MAKQSGRRPDPKRGRVNARYSNLRTVLRSISVMQLKGICNDEKRDKLMIQQILIHKICTCSVYT